VGIQRIVQFREEFVAPACRQLQSFAVAVISAIHSGEIETLERLLNENPGLATARIVDDRGGARTLLHIVADWPGHFPNGARSVATLIAAVSLPARRIRRRIRQAGTIKRRTFPKFHWSSSNASMSVVRPRQACSVPTSK
jgi:hypothetical protein